MTQTFLLNASTNPKLCVMKTDYYLLNWNRIVQLNFVAAFFTFSSIISIAQIQPGFGLNALPQDNEPICNIPVVSANPTGSGPAVGQMVQNFRLYEIDGTEHLLSDELSDGVPVLLISGSLTCPRFRDKIPDINNMSLIYGDALKIFIVYTVEAHPTTPSPYSGTIWITSQNMDSNILHPQPTTYGERKSLIDTLNGMYDINVPILVDGPCNYWWQYFGSGANNAFLIDPNGIVYAKHDWFNQYPLNMYCNIDVLTSMLSGQCLDYGTSGTFSFDLQNDSTAFGDLNDVLSVNATIINNSITDFVVLDIIKLDGDLPSNWETALCADICYTPEEDSIRISIPPGGQQEFIFYFYTTSLADSGNVNVLFRNAYVSNRIEQRFYGFTQNSASLDEHENLELVVYPNPTEEYCIIQNFDNFGENVEYTIYDSSGKIVDSGMLEEKMDLSHLTSGKYILFVNGENIEGSTSIIIH